MESAYVTVELLLSMLFHDVVYNRRTLTEQDKKK